MKDNAIEYFKGKKYYAATVTGKHVPNKEEAKELRRIMQKSGLTEKDVRKQKVYRVALANARELSQDGDGANAFKLRMRRFRTEAALELGTHINDPRVNGLARTRYFESRQRRWGYGWL
jgi:hypothetical protein